MTLTDKCNEQADLMFGNIEDRDKYRESRRFEVARECRRNGYEKYHNQRPYCTRHSEGCLYLDDHIDDKVGLYRCMMQEKQQAWKYINDQENIS